MSTVTNIETDTGNEFVELAKRMYSNLPPPGIYIRGDDKVIDEFLEVLKSESDELYKCNWYITDEVSKRVHVIEEGNYVQQIEKIVLQYV